MKGPQQYRRQPIKVQAIQYTGENAVHVLTFSDPDISLTELACAKSMVGGVSVETKWGDATLQEGDWLIRASGTDEVVVLDDAEFQRTHGR